MSKILRFLMVGVVALFIFSSGYAGELHEAAKKGNVSKIDEILENKDGSNRRKLIGDKDDHSCTPLGYAFVYGVKNDKYDALKRILLYMPETSDVALAKKEEEMIEKAGEILDVVDILSHDEKKEDAKLYGLLGLLSTKYFCKEIISELADFCLMWRFGEKREEFSTDIAIKIVKKRISKLKIKISEKRVMEIVKGVFEEISKDEDKEIAEEVKQRIGWKEMEDLKSILYLGANINAKNNNGDTLLHMAVKKKDITFLEILFNVSKEIFELKKIESARIDVGILNDIGYSPLHHVVLHNNTDMVKLFKKYGWGIDSKVIDGEAPVFKDQEWIQKKVGGKWTMLYHALRNKRFELAKVILARGADPEAEVELGEGDIKAWGVTTPLKYVEAQVRLRKDMKGQDNIKEREKWANILELLKEKKRKRGFMGWLRRIFG